MNKTTLALAQAESIKSILAPFGVTSVDVGGSALFGATVYMRGGIASTVYMRGGIASTGYGDDAELAELRFEGGAFTLATMGTSNVGHERLHLLVDRLNSISRAMLRLRAAGLPVRD
jgi:hypothetical protein